MGSFKSNGQNQGPDRRRNDRGQRGLGFPKVETLEGRILLDGSPPWKPTTTDLADVKNGPMGNEGEILVNVYQSYLKSGGNVSSLASRYSYLQFKRDKI